MQITSTLAMATAARRSMMELQTSLARSRAELESGRHADLGQSLGATMSQDFMLGDTHETMQTILSTNKLVGTRLGATQSALSGLADAAQTLRATLISAQNDGGDRLALETQAKSALQTFISTLNSGDGAAFLFAGVNTDVAPINDYFATPATAGKTALDAAFLGAFGVTQTNPAVAAIPPAQMQTFLSGPMAGLFSTNWSDWSNASSTQAQAQISLSMTVDLPLSANDSSLQHLAMAYTMLADLGGPNMSATTYAAVLQTATSTIDLAIDGLTRAQAQVGVTQSAVNDANRMMGIQTSFLQSRIADFESVDPMEAATRVNGLMTQIETSYSLTARLTQLSLAKYL